MNDYFKQLEILFRYLGNKQHLILLTITMDNKVMHKVNNALRNNHFGIMHDIRKSN